jgi:hypothetical protein
MCLVLKLFVDREREKSIRAKLAASTTEVMTELVDMRLVAKVAESEEHHL